MKIPSKPIASHLRRFVHSTLRLGSVPFRNLRPPRKIHSRAALIGAAGALILVGAVMFFPDSSGFAGLFEPEMTPAEEKQMAAEAYRRASDRLNSKPRSQSLRRIEEDLRQCRAQVRLQRSILERHQGGGRGSGFGMNRYVEAMGRGAGIAQASQQYQEIKGAYERIQRHYEAQRRRECMRMLTEKERRLVDRHFPLTVPTSH